MNFSVSGGGPTTPARPQHETEPSARRAQESYEPALTDVNGPGCVTVAVNGSVVVGGPPTWPVKLSPQHVTSPFAARAQLCDPPPLTWVNAPAGGVACPRLLNPQQAIVPSVRMAHVCT